MTTERAWELWRRWYGTAEIRKPPSDSDLRRWMQIDRVTWDKAVALVSADKERRKSEGWVQAFACGRGHDWK